MLRNISLICTTQLIFQSPLLLSSVSSQLSVRQTNVISFINFKKNINSYSSFLNRSVKKEEIFSTEDIFTPVSGIGKSKRDMFIGGIIAISLIFFTNFSILAFYLCVKSRSKENSNELSMSSSLFVNLNQDVKINPN
ncbi:hypothetical protein M9Y10_041944 [Tritrichomonas musculus]|uniref:Transmembrane protein n=1 Tax=Tritrichomonas musculus TaxID=1915356 RepID=A0ABR2K5T7_9EUKA